MDDEKDIVVQQVDAVAIPTSISDQYGHYLRESTVCNICRRNDRANIHLDRAREHLTIQEIADKYGVTKTDLLRHFEKHYIVSTANQEIISIYEKTDPVKKELISSVFDKNLDIVYATSLILKDYATQLNNVTNRINVLTDEAERDMLEEDERDELIELNKLSLDLKKHMLKAYEVIDKKLFPTKAEDLWNAILTYKLDALSKLLDGVLIVFAEFEKKSPEYAEMIFAIKEALRVRFNKLEEEILTSGGSLNPNN